MGGNGTPVTDTARLVLCNFQLQQNNTEAAACAGEGVYYRVRTPFFFQSVDAPDHQMQDTKKQWLSNRPAAPSMRPKCAGQLLFLLLYLAYSTGGLFGLFVALGH